MTLKDKLGVGLIGAGYWGKKLAYEYLELSKRRNDVAFKFLVDADIQRLTQVGNELQLPREMLQTDINAVLKSDAISAVHLALPNELHYPIGIQALESGKHVLLEKPMALNMREAVKLARKAEQQSLVLHIGHIFRFNNAVTHAKKLLDDGIIGKPLYYTLDWEALIPPPEGRDIIFDLGPHPIDVLNYLSNEWPTRLVTLGKSFLRKQPLREEVAETVAEFEEDLFAQIALSWLYAGPRKRFISLTGEEGTMEIDALDQHVKVYDGKVSRDYPIERNNTILSMITHFVNSILKGEPPQVSGLVGAMTVAVLSSMRESMNSKQFVNVLANQAA